MQRFKALDLFQKIVLIVLAIMIVLFTVLYALANSKVGTVYRKSFLTRDTEGENTVYSGEIEGMAAKFTVSPGGNVLYRYGDKAYGVYLVKQDDSIIANRDFLYAGEIGIEIWENGEMRFRGVLTDDNELIDENGNYVFPPSFVTINGTVVSVDGNGESSANADPDAPSLNTIASFALERVAANHKGNRAAWIVGVLLSAIIAVSMLYADELFRFFMSLRIRNAHSAQPSDWTLISRHLAWMFGPIAVLAIFIVGLNAAV